MKAASSSTPNPNDMNSPAEPSRRAQLFGHALRWELRRILWPLLLWLTASLGAAVFIHAADWTWPRGNDAGATIAQEKHRAAIAAVGTGLYLCIAAGVYFVGELFLPLQPGAVRGRFAWPVRRTDALLVSILISAVLVLLPLVLYVHGWLMAKGWDHVDEVYYRQYLPLPLCLAGLILAALTAGDWGMYLLTAALTVMAVIWAETSRIPEPLKTNPALLCTAAAITAAFVMQLWPHRWLLYAGWVLTAVWLL